jgi:MFS family permease
MATTTKTVPAPRAAAAAAGIGGSVTFLIVLLAVGGAVSDVQGVALLPLVGTMTKDLHLTATQTSWALTSLSVAAAVTLGLVARTADIIGHRRLLVPLTALGFAGAIIAALSGSFFTLTLGRVLMGCAISAPMMWALLKARADPEGMQRGALVNGTVISIFTPLGLILGGVLLNAGTSWTACFWIVAVGYAIQFVLSWMAAETPAEQRVRVPLDWMGSILLGGWLVCLLLGISNGQNWGWTSPAVLALLIGGVLLIGVWALQQRANPHALLDFRGMDLRQTFAGYATYCSVAAIASGLYIIVPAFAQTPSAVGYGFGASVLKSSMTLITILPATFIASTISKYMLARVGPRPPMILGGIMVTIAFVFGAFVHSELWHLYVVTAIYGVGIVICFNIGWALTAAAGRQDNMSITFGIQYALAVPVGALATAIMLAVMASAHIPGLPVPVPTEGTYQANFLILAGIGLVGLTALGAFVVPKKLSHNTSVVGPIGVEAGEIPV